MHRRVYKVWGKETRDWGNTYIQETDKETPLSWPQYTDRKWGPDLRGNRFTGLSLRKRAAHPEEWLTTPTKLSLGSESERDRRRGVDGGSRGGKICRKARKHGKTETRGSPEDAEMDAKGWEGNRERMAVWAEAVEGEVESLWHPRTPALMWQESSHGSRTVPRNWHSSAWINNLFQLMGCMTTPLSSDREVKIPIHSYIHTYPYTNLSFRVW